jgi:hypothetical protein
MRSVAEGQGTAAWQDLLACHRLARLVAQGGTLLDCLIGFAVEGIAAKADLELLHSIRLSGQELNECRRDLDRLAPMPPLADCVEHLERLVFVDVVVVVQRDGERALEQLGAAMLKDQVPSVDADRLPRPIANVDWYVTMRVGNRWYDRVVAAMRRASGAARDAEFARIDAELKAIGERGDTAANIQHYLNNAGADTEARGKQIAEALVHLLMPGFVKVSQNGDRHDQWQRNLRVAFALAAYQRDHSRYPETLASLVPNYLPEVPFDLFSSKALIYRPGEGGYLLYSVGVNRRDDQGHSWEDDPPGDDLAIRMPLRMAASK